MNFMKLSRSIYPENRTHQTQSTGSSFSRRATLPGILLLVLFFLTDMATAQTTVIRDYTFDAGDEDWLMDPDGNTAYNLVNSADLMSTGLITDLNTGAEGMYWSATNSFGTEYVRASPAPVVGVSSSGIRTGGRINLSLSMDVRYNINPVFGSDRARDGMRIEYRVGTAGTWTILADDVDAPHTTNWYNHTDIQSFRSGTITRTPRGWTGNNVGWQTVTIGYLPVELEDQTDIRFRVRFDCLARTGGIGTGAAFDNFVLSGEAAPALGDGPEIAVIGPLVGLTDMRRSAYEILSGDMIAHFADGTSFGLAPPISGSISRTFTIVNKRRSTANALTLTGPVSLSGADASDFTVVTQPASTTLSGNAPADNMTTFVVRFDPDRTDASTFRRALVTIPNDDPDEGSYVFLVEGTVAGGEGVIFYDFNAPSTDPWTNAGYGATSAWVRGTATSSDLSTGGDGEYWHTTPEPYTSLPSSPAIFTGLTSPVFDFTGFTNISLRARLRYNVDAGREDGLHIRYNTDGSTDFLLTPIPGANGIILGNTGGTTNWYNGANLNGFGVSAANPAGWTGDNSVWQIVSVDLPPELWGQTTVRFQVLFASQTGTRTVGVGAAIDDVSFLATVDREIDVIGNAFSIENGDMTPSPADNTDFGDLHRLTDPRASQTFTILNTGIGILTLSGTPLVVIGGADAGHFTVTAQPPGATLPGGGGTSFTIQFDRSGTLGLKTATVSIANDDPDDDPYIFAIQATGVMYPLPVKLTGFAGTVKDNVVVLTWTTVTELNNDYFEVQRSLDGSLFETIGRVEGNGTTNGSVDYRYVHSSPAAGASYYRLRQVDFDGVEELHHIIRVDNDFLPRVRVMEVKLYPNPTFDGNINLSLTSGDNHSPVFLRLIDMIGQVYYENVFDGSPEGKVAEALVPDRKMQSGIYLLIVNQGSDTSTRRLVIR